MVDTDGISFSTRKVLSLQQRFVRLGMLSLMIVNYVRTS
jgi:hypothetical protein